MQYRRFGRCPWEASVLGFGCMRLPTLGEYAQINEPEATRMVHYAIEHGVNYFDSAYGYHGGNSERFLGRALQGGYRQKVKLATKSPTWLLNAPEDFDRYLNEQLERLQTDHIDVYLLHGLNHERWQKLVQMDVLARAERALADGRIGHLGFSFHDKFEAFKEIVDAYPGWVMCQIQYNYMNEEEQAGTRGLEYAAAKGLAVVVMEPLLGGRIANPPAAVQAVWDRAPRRRSPVEWALQWLWNKPQVTLALSGMSTMEQVQENIALADASATNLLTAEELAIVAQARDVYRGLCPIPCTNCKYCMPCPNGVDIPRNFAIYNEGVMYNQEKGARWAYQQVPEAARASACIQCRECEDKCPQKIPISEWMPRVHEALG